MYVLLLKIHPVILERWANLAVFNVVNEPLAIELTFALGAAWWVELGCELAVNFVSHIHTFSWLVNVSV